MAITIRLAHNGATVSSETGRGVYRFDDENIGGLVELLYDIKEMIGPDGGRYSKERIYINVIHGDKYDCTDKQCEICRDAN